MALNFSLHFNCTTKVAYVKDDTVYSLPNSVYKYTVGSLISPLGFPVFSENTVESPLISYNTVPRVSSNYSLGATIPAGNYSLSLTNIYEYQNDNGGVTNQFLQVTATNEFYILNANLTGVLFNGTQVLITNSVDNDGTYTVSSVEYISNSNSTKITITANTLTPSISPDEDAIISATSQEVYCVNKVFTYSACSTSVCLDLSFTYDAFSTQYGSATLADLTNYYNWTISSRELNLYYPAGLSPAPVSNPVTTNNPNINVNELATGIYTGKLAVTVSNVQNDGLVLDFNLTKTKQFTVIAYTEMCDIQSCMQKMIDRHVSYLKSSNISPLQQYVDKVNSLYIMAKEALACGNKTSYSSYVAEIYTILGSNQDSCGDCSCGGSCGDCNDSCGCGQSDEPVWIDNLGLNVDSLLTEFENFMEDTLPGLLLLQGQVDALQIEVDALQADLSDLETAVSSIGSQTTTNTGDISGLTTQVETLTTDVTTLQEQVAEFSPANSEIVLNELFTNYGSQPLNFTAISGTPVSGSTTTKYSIAITGDFTVDFIENDIIVFYSPADVAWYEGKVTSSSYNSGTNITSVTLERTGTSSIYWQTNTTSFPVFKSKPDDSDYWFKRQVSISNNSFWKFNDATNKYWSKIKSSFLYNSSVYNNFEIYNSITGKTITLQSINPGSIVDFELTMEKQYVSGTNYNLVFLLDVKINSSRNLNGSSFAGSAGYVPSMYLDLYQNTTLTNTYSFSEFIPGFPALTRSGLIGLAQDVYGGSGNQNLNRLFSRFATGPSYPEATTSDQFFSGNVDNTIIFNNSNCNIVLLNFEVSYGKMPA